MWCFGFYVPFLLLGWIDLVFWFLFKDSFSRVSYVCDFFSYESIGKPAWIDKRQ